MLWGQTICCAIPSERVVIKKIPLDRGEADIDEALRWEIEQHIIGSIDDYVLDNQKLPVSSIKAGHRANSASE